MPQNLIRWREHRYLKTSLLLALVSVALYVSQGGQDAQPPNGGTWQGYVLGSLGALLIIWLSLLGVRKRRYSSTMGTVQGWTSAHVYLGTVLVLQGGRHPLLRCSRTSPWGCPLLLATRGLPRLAVGLGPSPTGNQAAPP